MNAKFELLNGSAKSIASLISMAAKPKDMTPILSYIRVVIADGKVSAYATDRYVLAQATAETIDHADDADFYLDANAAKFIKAQKSGNFEFEITDLGATIRANSASVTVIRPNGNYPPIQGFIDEFKPSETGTPALNLDLAKIGQVHKLEPITPANTWELDFSESSNGKPGPVRFQNGNIVALVQPNLLKR